MHPTPRLSSRNSSRRRLSAAPGFTLTEILIAIALLVTVVAMAVANLAGIMTSSQGDLAHVFVTETIDTPLLTYKMNTGTYPTTEQGLRALIVAPEGVNNWHGPYLTTKDIPTDPWKNEYHYRFPGTHNTAGYDCWSAGPDGQDGTADDIGNWN
jgi:general secretion pathway protein G